MVKADSASAGASIPGERTQSMGIRTLCAKRATQMYTHTRTHASLRRRSGEGKRGARARAQAGIRLMPFSEEGVVFDGCAAHNKPGTIWIRKPIVLFGGGARWGIFCFFRARGKGRSASFTVIEQKEKDSMGTRDLLLATRR